MGDVDCRNIFNHISCIENEYEENNPSSHKTIIIKSLNHLGYKYDLPNMYYDVLKQNPQLYELIYNHYRLAFDECKYDEASWILPFFHYKWCEIIVPILIDDYKKECIPDNMRWCISDALYTIHSKKYLDDYVRIANDKRYGINRQLIILLIGRVKSDESIDDLICLLNDRQVELHALYALSNYKKLQLRYIFESYLKSDNSAMRRRAKKWCDDMMRLKK